MSLALYRKYRSQNLDEIIGQDHITNILKASIKNNNLAQAYLFTGPRGTGKTSTARILAHLITGTKYGDNSLDIVELDAASNNGVEQIRDIIDKVQVVPTSAPKKVYIIDEVHMMSTAAFNAFLKTLEEPPEHVVFILATTNFDKIPDTIASRTQRFHFHLISSDVIQKHLAEIAKKEKIKISEQALALIAKRGKGSFRDSISLLDQVKDIPASGNQIEASDIESSLGLASAKIINEIVDCLSQNNTGQIVKIINEQQQAGTSIRTLASQIADEIYAELESKPEFIRVLEKIDLVEKSANPSVALMLALFATINFSDKQDLPKNSATKYPVKTVSAATTSLKPNVIKTEITTSKQEIDQDQPKPQPQNESENSDSLIKKELKPQVKSDSDSKDNPENQIPEKTVPKQDLANFDWEEVTKKIDEIADFPTGVKTIIHKSKAVVDGSEIKLYALNSFNKKRLEDPKHIVFVSQMFRISGFENVNLTILGKSAPPTDPEMAKIAEIMGGGEEVNV